MFEWNSFAFISLICFLLSSVGATLALSAKRSGEALLWGLICILLSLWMLCLFFSFSADGPEDALFWARALNYVAIFLPASLFHFCTYFAGKASYFKRLTGLYYFLCAGYFLLAVLYPEQFLHSPTYRFSEFWFPNAGPLFYFFPVIYACLIGHGVYILIASKADSSRSQRRKIHYLLITVFLGLVAAVSSFSMEFGLDIPPYGIFSIAFVVLIATYAILKHDLLGLPETVSLITARVLIYIIIFAVVVSIIKLSAYFDDVYFSGFQVAIIYLLMVLICELYALMKSRVQSLSDSIITKRKMTGDRHFKHFLNQLELAADFEIMLPLLRTFFESQSFIYHYAWYLDQSLLSQSLKKDLLTTYDRPKGQNGCTYQRILFSASDGRRHDRLPVSLRFSENVSKKSTQGYTQIMALMDSEQMDQAYQWVEKVPGRELIALPLVANSALRGLIILVVNQGDMEYSEQLMFRTLSAKLALAVERFDSILEESRKQNAFILEKMQSLQVLAADVASEMQFPLSQMDGFISEVCVLSDSMLDQQVDIASVAHNLRVDALKARLAVERSAQLIDIILRQVQELEVDVQSFDTCSIQSVVSKALAEYVFIEDQRAYVNTDLSRHFNYRGNEELLVFVIFNLLKDILSQTEYPPSFEIYISTAESDNMNWLKLKFNHHINYRAEMCFGTGADNKVNVMNKKTLGSNLSLAYCHKVMNLFSGKLLYQAHGETLSEFKLGFPIID